MLDSQQCSLNFTLLLPLQYAGDYTYNGESTSVYFSSFAVGDKFNNYTLLVDKVNKVSLSITNISLNELNIFLYRFLLFLLLLAMTGCLGLTMMSMLLCTQCLTVTSTLQVLM